MATHRPPSSRDIELLSAYIDNELSERERAALEARLDREPRLQQELEELTAVVGAVRALPPLQAPRDFTLTPEMVAREEQEQKTAATVLIFPTSTVFSALSAAAATLLIVFGALMLFVQPAPVQDASFAPQAAENNIAAQPTAPITAIPEATIMLVATATPPPTQMPSPTLLSTPTFAPAEAQGEAGEMETMDEIEMEEMDVAEDAADGSAGAPPAERADVTQQAAQTMQSAVADDAATAGAFAAETDPRAGEADTDGLTFVTDTPDTGQTIVVVPPTATVTARATPAPLSTRLPGAIVPQRQSPTSTAAIPPSETVQPRARIDPAQVIGLSSLVVGVALMGVAAMTTIARRRRHTRGRS